MTTHQSHDFGLKVETPEFAATPSVEHAAKLENLELLAAWAASPSSMESVVHRII